MFSKPRVSVVMIHISNYLSYHGSDANLPEVIVDSTNRLLYETEVVWLRKQGRYKEARALHPSGDPTIKFELEEFTKIHGFNRVVGKYGDIQVIIMVPYELVDINTVQKAIEDIPVFKAYIDDLVINHNDDTKWNACPIMLVNDFGDKHKYELNTCNLDIF